MQEKENLETIGIHFSEQPEPTTGALIPPIYFTSIFLHEEPGITKGYDYSRTKNPTRMIVENKLARIENGKFGLCFASGMSAINNILLLLKPTDRVVSERCIYGGTHRIFTKVYSKFGVDFSFVDCTDLEDISSKIDKHTKIVWLETPTNPLLTIIDIKEISKIAHEQQALVVVDNTFATPCLQQPLKLGSDIVIHSTTKYISGHTDMIGGAVITSIEKVYEIQAFFQNTVGAVPSPFDCWLLNRSVKTLPVRMKQHCENAREVADFLESQPKIKKVYYPGLKSHPQHDLAKKQMRGFGGILSFELKNGRAAIKRFLKNLKIFSLAVSLGGVESLVEQPATMSHASMPLEERKGVGIHDNLIRLSIGLENVEDILDDLQVGLNAI
jgi:cystathionine beta-lyase/cystathionine gamma-synthase